MLTVPIFSLDRQDRALTYTGTRAKVSVSYVPGGVGLGFISVGEGNLFPNRPCSLSRFDTLFQEDRL